MKSGDCNNVADRGRAALEGSIFLSFFVAGGRGLESSDDDDLLFLAPPLPSMRPSASRITSHTGREFAASSFDSLINS